MVTPSTLWLLIKHLREPQREAVWVGEGIRLSWQILCYLMTEQVNHEIYIYFIVSHLWKLEIRHKSNLKRQQQITALTGIQRETFMQIERHYWSYLKKYVYYLYKIYENNVHFEYINTVESFFWDMKQYAMLWLYDLFLKNIGSTVSCLNL